MHRNLAIFFLPSLRSISVTLIKTFMFRADRNYSAARNERIVSPRHESRLTNNRGSSIAETVIRRLNSRYPAGVSSRKRFDSGRSFGINRKTWDLARVSFAIRLFCSRNIFVGRRHVGVREPLSSLCAPLVSPRTVMIF